MDFADRIKALAGRIGELKSLTCTEEATKTALVLPFLQALGYDAFDPRVVIPEYTADIGTKKGEKVDYAIQRGGEIIMLIEAKCAGCELDAGKASQLHRYFHNTTARIGILTDGIMYQFFTDLEKPNIMDERPFMVFDFTAIEPQLVGELKKLCFDCFDADVALSAAQDLKYLRQIKALIAQEVKSPSDEFVRFFAKSVYEGQLRNNVLEDFRDRVRLAFTHFVNDELNARLQGAIQNNEYPVKTPEEAAAAEGPSREERIETTEEEREGFYIIKAIVREVVDPARVVMRDTISYCGVLLDDNNRKPICRLHLNSPTVKYLETIDADKKGTRHKIDSLNDIYQYADALKATAAGYDAE